MSEEIEVKSVENASHVEAETPKKAGLPGVISGKKKQPPKVLIYGVPGVGKSTFAASAPKPIFVQTEDGLHTIGADRFPVAESSTEVVRHLSTLLVEDHQYRTVVIDTLDKLATYIQAEMCAKQGWNSLADSPYASYKKIEPMYWAPVFDVLEKLHTRRSMIVVLLAHSEVYTHSDPESEAYTKYTARLEKKVQERIIDWVDAIGFATTEKRVKKVDEKFGTSRPIAKPVIGEGDDMGGKRILRFVDTPTCLAKNRYGIVDNIPLDWRTFFAYVTESWK